MIPHTMEVPVHWNDGWHMMGGMGVWWILILIVVGLVAWFIVTQSRRRDYPTNETPEQVVKRRYANGEISREEYERILEDLRK